MIPLILTMIPLGRSEVVMKFTQTTQVFPAPLKQAGVQTNLLGFRHCSFLAPPPNFLLRPPMGRPKNHQKTKAGSPTGSPMPRFLDPNLKPKNQLQSISKVVRNQKKNQETRKTPPIFGPVFLGPSLNKSASMVSMAGCDGSSGCDLAHFGATEVGGAAHRSPLQHPIGGPCLQMGLKNHPPCFLEGQRC